MSIDKEILHRIDEQRASQGFHTVSELLDFAEQDNRILDPFSVLISTAVSLGSGNQIYPNVVIEIRDESRVTIGDNNVFYPNSLFIAEGGGSILVGDNNQFGDGGCYVKASNAERAINIGSNGRYINGAQILGRTTLGSGSQVIGPITVQDCVLEEGGDFEHADPDTRAGVLKGSGLARGLTITTGAVLNGLGTFDADNIEVQSKYHPKSK